VHDETAGLQDGPVPTDDDNPDNIVADPDNDDITAPAGLVSDAETASSQVLTAIGAVQTIPTFDFGGDGPGGVTFDISGSGIQSGDDTGVDVSSDGGDVTYVVVDANLILGVEDYVSDVSFGNVDGDNVAQFPMPMYTPGSGGGDRSD